MVLVGWEVGSRRLGVSEYEAEEDPGYCILSLKSAHLPPRTHTSDANGSRRF